MNPYRNSATHLSTAQALVTSINGSIQSHQLVVDCGANHHIFNSTSFFLSISEITNITVSTDDSNGSLNAHGIGIVIILCNSTKLTLKNCLYVPHLNCSLVSLLDIFGNQLTINQKGIYFSLVTNGKILLRGCISNRLMYFDYSLPRGLLSLNSTTLWHNHFGHRGPTPFKRLGLPLGSINCITCNLNKDHPLLFCHEFEPANLPLDCVHIYLVSKPPHPLYQGFNTLSRL
ncbi:hypothetical protein O181_024010 [Austropuccinia psidii MF-1]|uniref:Retrovirus-related Pol polyprotein from transposon TNT 1-94-like beta-barrel domain-containing protein n=1 Tax=Austropuccinia psidii MF-1 TaxID=1389203 RepID=A0A9Q3CJQ2_9BASI|nr:hypothetical protein [Austropuccinia psidii MF-1]